MEALIAVVGTLAGASLGGLWTFLNQRSAYRREADERLAGVRRETYVGFAAAVFGMFEEIGNLHSRHRSGALSKTETVAGLRSVSSKEVQAALEALRLVASDAVAAAAATLWERIRRDPVPLGDDLSEGRYQLWREEYWRARRALVDAARKELGLSPLDWSLAGVGLGKTPSWTNDGSTASQQDSGWAHRS